MDAENLSSLWKKNGGSEVIGKIFLVIAVIGFGLAALAFFFHWLFSEIELPEWADTLMAWIVVIGVSVGIVCLTTGCSLLLLGI